MEVLKDVPGLGQVIIADLPRPGVEVVKQEAVHHRQLINRLNPWKLSRVLEKGDHVGIDHLKLKPGQLGRIGNPPLVLQGAVRVLETVKQFLVSH
ncbi:MULTISPECIES: hypothetical protein [Limosilactobacillus]|jgi:hypothetical protein|uniref:hypothetical protein n=1 Tax=Limosilactobacillus TaxID=2742598 RepID=UPI000709D2CD|nr:hypothetical protein [Limosilactobacillus pontis]MCX2187057.1 hypothetical protein [Limosilactobacillus pontis]MCX2188955.1 hypothetical protein [Limosilactobacillus pontis]QFV00562.1 hypothetical protein LP475_01915 [Limosilactobacillus pontis]